MRQLSARFFVKIVCFSSLVNLILYDLMPNQECVSFQPISELPSYFDRKVQDTCIEYEQELTRQTVLMSHMVSGPIGLKADVLVDRDKKFYWCKVPKAASSSWTNLFLSDKSIMKRIQRDDNSLREKNKAKKFYNKYGKKIIAKYRDPTKPQQDPKYKSAPTFVEFVDYLLDTEPLLYDEHWLPYYLHCLPCHLNYTMVAKTETLTFDNEQIILELNQRGLNIHNNRTKLLAKLHASTVNLPSTLYFEELGKERVKALYDKYEIDFKMFDYSIEPYLSYAANTLGVGNKIKSFNN